MKSLDEKALKKLSVARVMAIVKMRELQEAAWGNDKQLALIRGLREGGRLPVRRDKRDRPDVTGRRVASWTLLSKPIRRFPAPKFPRYQVRGVDEGTGRKVRVFAPYSTKREDARRKEQIDRAFAANFVRQQHQRFALIRAHGRDPFGVVG